MCRCSMFPYIHVRICVLIHAWATKFEHRMFSYHSHSVLKITLRILGSTECLKKTVTLVYFPGYVGQLCCMPCEASLTGKSILLQGKYLLFLSSPVKSLKDMTAKCFYYASYGDQVQNNALFSACWQTSKPDKPLCCIL